MYALDYMESLTNFEYVEVFLDSLDSVPTNPGYSNTDWPTFYLIRTLNNIAAIKVLQAEIPFSYYVVNSFNNTFSLTEPAGTATVTIPVGNYNSSTMATALATALTTTSAGLSGRTYTVSYSQLVEKFTITASVGDFSLTFGASNETNPRQILGFPSGVSTSSGSVLTASFTSQLTGPNYVYLNSSQLGSITPTELPQNAVNLSQGLKGPQIARIPIQCNAGDVSFYNDPAPERWFGLENLRQIQNFDLYLTLGNTAPERALRLNGQNFSVKLGVLLYKEVKSNYSQPTPGFGQPTVIGSTQASWRFS
jgi:hypothetical protein